MGAAEIAHIVGHDHFSASGDGQFHDVIVPFIRQVGPPGKVDFHPLADSLRQTAGSKLNGIQTASTLGCFFLFQPLGQKNLQQRLVGNITLVRQYLEPSDDRFRQPQRNRPKGRLQVGQNNALGFGPIEVRVESCPAQNALS